jgi:hypothetical protein
MKRSLVIAMLFLVPFSVWSFEYAGVGFGPNISMKGERPTNFFIQGEWQPHKVVGTKLYMGFYHGFWLGAALNFKQNIAKMFRTSYWDVNFAIPFMMNISKNSRIAYVGFTAGTTLSFDINGQGRYYFFVTPVDIWITPYVWRQYPSLGWDKELSISYMFSTGIRMSI